MRYVTTKLNAISVPAMLKVHSLCRERLTSHGAADKRDATGTAHSQQDKDGGKGATNERAKRTE
jgi:hypothetical protein